MKKRTWNRALSMVLAMVTVISLLSGCGEKSAEKEDAETITVYLWTTSLYEKYAPYIQEQLPDIISILNLLWAIMIWISTGSFRKMADCRIL